MGFLPLPVGSTWSDQSLQFIKNTWKKFAPIGTFDFYFLDQKLDQYYKSEQTLGKLTSLFSMIAILIACLGLLGLISFLVERKTKEIAMRKVLGATLANIIQIISKEFIVLIMISNIIAWPIAYYAMNKWLQNFAYRIVRFADFPLTSEMRIL